MSKTTKLIFPLLFSALVASGCAQAIAAKSAETGATETQITQIDLKKTEGKTKLVLVKNGDAQTFNWSAADLADPAALDKALAEVPEAERENIKKLLSQMKDGKGLQLVTEGDHNVTVHQLGADGAKVLTNKKVIMHKIDGGDGSEFSLLKSLLKDAKLNKEQLQELQKLLDSKF